MNPNLKNKEYLNLLESPSRGKQTAMPIFLCADAKGWWRKIKKLTFLSKSRNKILTGPNCDFLFLGVFGERWLGITYFFLIKKNKNFL